MENSYDHDQYACTASTSTLPPAVSSSSSPPDEISLFLQQFLLRTSSATAHGGKQAPCSLLSTSPSIFSELTRAFTPEDIHPSCGANAARDEISAVDSSEAVNSSSCHVVPSRSCLRPSAANAFSTLVGVSENENENENDEFDCESEEGLEALVEELPTKRNPCSSSKRSRAAEVHNLSEKRRRSRINEKMKALQNLIPNSNKTDKASMLDEAIEYLKHLQLQVQMLSMRNGLSLHPMNLPGHLQYLQLSHMRMNLGEENRSLPADQQRPTQILFGSTMLNHPLMPEIERVNAETPFELEPTIRAHPLPFHLNESSKEICREDVLRDHRVNMNQPETTPSLFEFEMGSTAAVSVSPHYNMAAAPDLQGLQNGVPLEIIERNQSGLRQEGQHQVRQ